MITLIVRGRAQGKTTEALKALHDKGGGVYICRTRDGARQAAMIANKLGLENISFLETDWDRIVVDSDNIDVIVTQNDERRIEYNG